MADDRDEDEGLPDTSDGIAMPPLPRPIQEHLGRQLRSAYNETTDKPAYLGDTNVPPEFERLIRRIETTEKVHEVGVEAVRQALQPRQESANRVGSRNTETD